jgi:hypothetical protein
VDKKGGSVSTEMDWPLGVVHATVAAATRVHLTCITNKVIIIDTPTGSSSSDTKENLNFWIDEASKKVSFADGVPLSIQRFDDRWISVTGGRCVL